MSNTTIVAVTNSYNDTVTMLPPSAYIDEIGNVIFHNNPRIEFDGASISSNFDHHIDFRITKNKLHSELVGDSYNHYPRMKRRTQYLNVFKFNKGRPLDSQITIPHYYMATLREGEHVGITNFGIPKCDKVVIKEQLGARGSNQVVVPTNMLTTLLKHSKNKTLGEVKEAFPDLIYTDNSDWDMVFFADPNTLFVSELITNVKSEYRLLVGGKKMYGRERAIKAGPYPQANLDVDKFHTVQEVNYEPIEDMFDYALVETLYAFVEYIDLPIGSIDLYSTTDGKWGIFEYSTQFAFHGANPNFIKQLLLDGVKKVLLANRRIKNIPTELTSVEQTAPVHSVVKTEAGRFVTEVSELYLKLLTRMRTINATTDDNTDVLEYSRAPEYEVHKNEITLSIYLEGHDLTITKGEQGFPSFYLSTIETNLATYIKDISDPEVNAIYQTMYAVVRDYLSAN